MAAKLVAKESPTQALMWRRFGRNLSINVSGTFLSALLTLVQTAILTKSLSLDNYGFVLIITNLFLFLETFVGINVGDVLFRYFQIFKEENRNHALQGLLLICLLLCLAAGLIISAGTFFLSAPIADRIYHNSSLSILLKIYSATVLITACSGFYDPLLRMHDRFLALTMPKVAGRLFTVTVFATYLGYSGSLSIRLVVVVITAGVVIQTLPPLILSLRLVWPCLSATSLGSSLRALLPHRRELSDTIWHVNLVGYLRMLFSPGDIFLLGLLSSPTDVALYGVAKQLLNPLVVLQNNTQMAITPEITTLAAKRDFRGMKRLADRYVTVSFLISSGLALAMFSLGPWLISLLSKPSYLAAWPLFRILLLVSWLTLVTLVFYPLGLTLDRLKWYNLGQCVNIGILIAVLIAGRIDALSMAYLQLAASVIITLLFSLPIGLRLRALASRPPIDSAESNR